MSRFFSTGFVFFLAAHAACANMVQNPDFKAITPVSNPWSGVDKEGFIAGATHQMALLAVRDGALTNRPIPPSVALADMNGNGKLDIVMMDGWNYLRIFFNQGTAKEPQFSTADLSPFNIRLTPQDPITKIEPPHHFGLRWSILNNYIYGGRIAITEAFNPGRKDIIMANYAGDVYPIMNTGTSNEPNFPSLPKGSLVKQRIPIRTSKPEEIKNWGSLLTPLTADFFGNRRQDLIFGEASYSANNIHIFRNKGGSDPKAMFDPADHHVIAYGDGREWLSPCAVDYNGNGKPDLLVADGTGKVSVHLNAGKPWKSGEKPSEMELTEYVKTASGQDLTFGGPCTIAVGDLNGDGLFDIIAGKANGRVAVAYNVGTKQEPKFSPPVEIKSTAILGKKPPSEQDSALDKKVYVEQITIPNQWTIDWGINRGNFYCVPQVLKTEDDDKGIAPGTSYIHISYKPTPHFVLPAITDAMYPRMSDPNYSPETLFRVGTRVTNGYTSRCVKVTTSFPELMVHSKRYVYTFKYKGNFVGGLAGVGYGVARSVATARNDDRQRVDHKLELSGNGHEINLSPTSTWKEERLEFTVVIPDKELRGEDIRGGFTFSCEFANTRGELSIADLKVVPK